jgi:hypothetical protein
MAFLSSLCTPRLAKPPGLDQIDGHIVRLIGELSMKSVMILLKRKPGLSFEQFREHYETSHAKLGEKYFGHLFASYRRNYIPQGTRFGDGAAIEPAYDCVTELVFRDPEGYQELRRIASDPEVRKVLLADEERFLDRMGCANAIAHPVESEV